MRLISLMIETYESEADLVKSEDEVRNGHDDPAVASSANLNASTGLLRDGDAPDRVLKTLFLFYSSLIAGLCNVVIGSTLVHLEYLFDVSIGTISLALLVQSLGDLFGSLICGLVFDHVNHELAFAVASLLQGISNSIAPFVGGLVPFMVAMCFQATSTAFIICGAQSYCIRLWKGHRFCGPSVHTSHAVWSLGGMVGPFIVAPFLVALPQQQQFASTTSNWSKSPIDDYDFDSTSYASRASTDKPTLPSVNASVLPLHVGVSGLENVRYAYVTVGLLALVTHFLFVIVYLRGGFKDSSATTPSSRSSKDSSDSRSKESNVDCCEVEHSQSGSEDHRGDFRRLDRYLYLIFIASVLLFYILYCYGFVIPLYITTFAIKYLDFAVQDASLVLSLFFGFMFIGRVIGIPLAAFVAPRSMLIVNVLSTAASFVLLLAFVNAWPTIIWITAPTAGFFMATTFAAGLLWINERLAITGRLSGIIFVGLSSGAIVGPLIVGQLFETTPLSFTYSLAVSSVSHVVVTFGLMVYGARYGARVTRYANAGLPVNNSPAVASMDRNGYKSTSKSEDNLELNTRSKTNEVPSQNVQ